MIDEPASFDIRRMPERAPLEQRESFLTCTWSCSAAGYDPTVCASLGCQALKGEHMAQESAFATKADPRTYGSGRDSDPRMQQDRASALKAVSMPLDDLSRELDVIRKRTYELAQGVAHIADKLLGSEPEPENTGGADQPPRQGTAWQLNDQARYIQNCLNELERQISRLTPLVAG